MILKQKNETQTKICVCNYLELKVRIEIDFTKRISLNCMIGIKRQKVNSKTQALN